MKEVKFKAFDKINKEVCEVGFIDFPNKKVQLAIVRDGICYKEYLADLKDVELLQYTGLEDKNERELYQSDITKDKFGNLDVICWINSSGAYATVPINLYLEGEYEYTVVDEFGTDCFFENNAPGDFLEIVGNVYENPELLEESK